MKPNTALFFPCSRGVGFGYIGRALLIAEELRASGWRCVFGSDTAEGLIGRCGFEVCAPKSKHGTSVPDMPERRGEYIPLDGLDTVFGMMRYYHRPLIAADVQEDLQVIRAVRPDVVVIDMHPTAGIAARHAGLPLVSVADSDFLRNDSFSWMPWISPGDLPSSYPSCVAAFNQVLGEFELPPIRHVSDLLWGRLTLLASTADLEGSQPPIDVRGPLEYVGPMFWDPPWSDAHRILDAFGRESTRRIYVTLGHGGKVLRSQVQAILEACDHQDWSVFVSLGFRPLDGAPLTLPRNVRSGEFTGLTTPLGWCDAAIHHGGYATVLATLQFGKPSMIIPFMSEQEANGRLFTEALGAGFVLRKTVPVSKSGQRLEFQFRYSGATANGEVRPEEVRRGLEEIFEAPSYRQCAEAMSIKLRATIQGRRFLPLIERVMEMEMG